MEVIPAVPNVGKFEGEEEWRSDRQRVLADKARAEVGEFRISQAKPTRRAAGKTGAGLQPATGTSAKPVSQNT